MNLFSASQLPLLIVRLVTLVIALTVHEYAHARVAYAFGDSTAKNAGRLTLNPLAHLDPFGSLMVLLAGFGWAKPVPVNPYALNRKSGMMWVSAAGPLSNFLLALIAGLILRVLPAVTALSWLRYFLVHFAVVNISLGVFNLIPLPPLDGSKVLDYFLPASARRVWNEIQAAGPALLMIFVLVLPRLGFDLIGWILSPIVRFLFRLFVGG